MIGKSIFRKPKTGNPNPENRKTKMMVIDERIPKAGRRKVGMTKHEAEKSKGGERRGLQVGLMIYDDEGWIDDQ
jgi:hypothetical protein